MWADGSRASPRWVAAWSTCRRGVLPRARADAPIDRVARIRAHNGRRAHRAGHHPGRDPAPAAPGRPLAVEEVCDLVDATCDRFGGQVAEHELRWPGGVVATRQWLRPRRPTEP